MSIKEIKGDGQGKDGQGEDGHALLFIGKGEGKSSSGRSLPQTWVFKSQMMPGSRITKEKANAFKSVRAIWHDKKSGEKKTVTAGEGSPVHEITHARKTEDAVKRAEGQILVAGLRPSVPPVWSITSVTHRLNGAGYSTQIRGELPKVR